MTNSRKIPVIVLVAPAIGLKKVKGEEKEFNASAGTLVANRGMQGIALIIGSKSLVQQAEDKSGDLLIVKLRRAIPFPTGPVLRGTRPEKSPRRTHGKNMWMNSRRARSRRLKSAFQTNGET